MTADEQREVEFRRSLLDLAGQHCPEVKDLDGAMRPATAEEVVARAETYQTFCDAGRLTAKGTGNVKLVFEQA